MVPLLLVLSAVTILALAGCFAVRALRSRRCVLANSRSAIGNPASFVRPGVLTHELRPAPLPGAPTDIARITGLTMREAEDLLDWLEQNGYSERELRCETDKFTVEFRVDVGHTKPGPHQMGQIAPRTSAS